MQRNLLLSLACLFLLATGLLIAACGSDQSQGAAPGAPSNPTMAQVAGQLYQVRKDVKITGTANLSGTLTSSTPMSITVEIDANNRFSFDSVQPGTYVLEISVSLTPCFLGAPGQVFNGMMGFYQSNWSGTGLSFKDGSSFVTGSVKELIVLTAGQSVSQSLALPQCW